MTQNETLVQIRRIAEKKKLKASERDELLRLFGAVIADVAEDVSMLKNSDRRWQVAAIILSSGGAALLTMAVTNLVK